MVRGHVLIQNAKWNRQKEIIRTWGQIVKTRAQVDEALKMTAKIKNIRNYNLIDTNSNYLLYNFRSSCNTFINEVTQERGISNPNLLPIYTSLCKITNTNQQERRKQRVTRTHECIVHTITIYIFNSSCSHIF